MCCLSVNMLLKAWRTLETLTKMFKFFFFLFSLFLLLSFATAHDDSIAMLELAKALKPTPINWFPNDSTNYCSWPGIDCDPSNRVVSINICNLSLSGTLPSRLSTLSKLQYLHVQYNHLSGPIPSLAKLSDLREVSFAFNKFTSFPQGFFQGLTGLQFFFIGDNTKLDSWSIPTDLIQCRGLITFDAHRANVQGTIPDIFASLRSLQHLRLHFNNLTGGLPGSFRNSGIQDLKLNNQKMGLSGNINVLSSMTQLGSVWLHKNKFTGSIPDLSKCDYLFNVQLNDNILTGIVPASLMSLPKLQRVYLSNNKLQGHMPKFHNGVIVGSNGKNHFCSSTPGANCDSQVTTMLEIAGSLGYPEKLSDHWRGNDACNNWSFLTCNIHKRIIEVNLGMLNFTGSISSAFCILTKLKKLCLNDNKLENSIPDCLTKLTRLQVLNVSNNNLTGKVPDFASSVNLITKPGNDLLQMNWDPNQRTSISPLNVAIFVIAIVILVSCLICGGSAKKYYEKFAEVKKVSHEKGIGSIINEKEALGGLNVVIPIEVLQQVTDDFSEKNILGEGGFGVVYKGELHNKTKIAVKKMEITAMSTKGMNGFQAEIEVLSKVRHRHLVDLLGYCIKGNEGFLVYEYMPQGTLGQHLFEWRQHRYLPLTWNQRISIALDVAHGVEYLHSLAQQSFIHRDLKPSNILLGDGMRAKVGDFGLVKHVPNGKHSLETRVAGTFGYLAPEYAATGRVTTKVDVYAFGVILMEMITGRKALDYTMEDKGWMFMHLVTWFHGVLINKEKIPIEIIDKTLNLENHACDNVCKVAELAVHCTNPEPCQRPDIGHAISILTPLLETSEPVGQKQEQTSAIKLNFSCLSQDMLSCQACSHIQSTDCVEFATPRHSQEIPNAEGRNCHANHLNSLNS